MPGSRCAGIAPNWSAGLLMLGFVLAAAAGLLGNGPLDHCTGYAASGPLHVDYEAAVRYGTGTQITFHLRAESAGADTARLFVGSGFVEPFGLQRITPQPVRSEATHGGMALSFPMPSGASDVLVRMTAEPASIGPVGLLARDEHGVELRWTQWVPP
nr:hypothetical protein [uncultured Lichenicoccus sp.]